MKKALPPGMAFFIRQKIVSGTIVFQGPGRRLAQLFSHFEPELKSIVEQIKVYTYT